MKFFFKLLTSSILLLALLVPLSFSGQATAPSTGYHDYSSLTKALQQLAAEHKDIMKLTSIGKTKAGRDLWMAEITGIKGPSAEEKQALLICGNAEGDHVIGSEVALGIAQYLVDSYGKEKKVTQILDKRIFFILPRLNPDGAELFFEKTLMEYSGNLKPRDEDYDWLIDEDGPEDINGDNKITKMRAKDKEGDWIIDEKDPRLMKKKASDSHPDKLYKLYSEGIDNDGDELYNEDGPGGFNINRNFPHNFGYKQKGFKVYPASEAETRALIDFMSKYIPEKKTQPHRNICGILLFSKFDNLAAGTGIECGTPTFPEPDAKQPQAMPSMRMFFMMGRRGDAQAAPQSRPTDPQPKKTETRDTALFEKVSKQYKEITGIKSAVSDKPAGSILEWGYFQFGVPTFSANLWSLRQEESGRPQAKPQQKSETTPGSQTNPDARRMMFRQLSGGMAGPGQSQTANNDEKWLKWIDDKNDKKGFVEWSKFNHKQLGEVEIGGFQPYLRVNPTADQIQDLSKNHAEFALYLAEQFAEIVMQEPEIKKLSSGVFELKVKVKNQGQFPYATAMGQRTSNITPIMLRLKFEDEKNMELFGSNSRVNINSLDASAEREYKWIILSPSGKKLKITLWARNGGGTIQKDIVLN